MDPVIAGYGAFVPLESKRNYSQILIPSHMTIYLIERKPSNISQCCGQKKTTADRERGKLRVHVSLICLCHSD